MNKKIILPVILALAFVGVGFAAVLIHTFSTTINVNEAFSSTETDATINAVLGTTVIQTVHVSNQASVPLQVKVSFTETANANGVIYTTNSPVTQTLQPGANTVDLTFAISAGSPVGSFTGEVDIERV